MDVLAEIGQFGETGDEIVLEADRMGRSEADAIKARHGADGVQQLREGRAARR